MSRLKQNFNGDRLIFRSKGAEDSHFLGDFIGSQSVLNDCSIYDFLLFGTILPPLSPLSGVSTLFPGELEEGDNQYRHLDVAIKDQSLEKFVSDFDDLLTNYFSNYSRKDKALLLSGGIDSAIILSYLGKDTTCLTWGGWGEKSSDIVYSKMTADRYGVAKHIYVQADYDRDIELYEKKVKELKIPLLFSNVIPFIRLSEAGQQAGLKSWLMGQNADTVLVSYAPEVAVRRLSVLNNWLPFNPLWFSNNRKRHLFSTRSLIRLFAYFKSNGIFPGRWIKLPQNYFEEKEAVLAHYLKPQNLSQKIILTEEFLSEARRNQVYQNEIPLSYGIKVDCPYYTKQFINLALSVPDRLRRAGNYDKIIFKELAKKRNVPLEVINKGKKGLSYGSTDFIKEKKHISIWDAMESDDFLNKFVNVKEIRKTKEDDFLVFDVLRSLYSYGRLVVKPHNIKF